MIWSYGSGYGGNSLLGKKCYSLRIASVMARDEGWLAEHMLILKLTSPAGEGPLHRRRVPQRLRQDQPGDAGADHPRLEGRDARRRHRLDALRRGRPALRGQPRVRLFGVAPGTGWKTNPNAMRTIEKGNSVFTNVALTDDGDIWWEGMDEPPAHLTDWKGRDWTPEHASELVRRTRTAASARRSSSARSSRRSTTTRRACRSRRSSSAAAARRPSRW